MEDRFFSVIVAMTAVVAYTPVKRMRYGSGRCSKASLRLLARHIVRSRYIQKKLAHIRTFVPLQSSARKFVTHSICVAEITIPGVNKKGITSCAER